MRYDVSRESVGRMSMKSDNQRFDVRKIARDASYVLNSTIDDIKKDNLWKCF